MPKMSHVMGAFVLGLFGAGLLFFASPVAQQAFPSAGDAEVQEATKEAAESSALCGDDGIGELRLAISNPLNSSATEYKAHSVRLYNPDGEFTGTLTTTTAGLPAEGSGTECSYCGEEYEFVVLASDASSTSYKGTLLCKDGSGKTVNVPEQAGLLFKVRDEENYAYVYGSAETTAGGLQASGTTFYSTTSNDTGRTIGIDESYDYTIWAQTNKTAATDTQFTDKAQLIAVNADDLSDWSEPSVTVDGAATTKTDCPTKISNDGYDWCYDVTVNGGPMIMGGDFVKTNINQQALPGVNPSDNIVVGFFTSGYYKHTLDEGYDIDYNKDDASKSYVYTGQTVTFAMA